MLVKRRLKGAKDKVKKLEELPARSRAPGGAPRLLVSNKTKTKQKGKNDDRNRYIKYRINMMMMMFGNINSWDWGDAVQ